jgi:hypothetical protein
MARCTTTRRRSSRPSTTAMVMCPMPTMDSTRPRNATLIETRTESCRLARTKANKTNGLR